MHLAIFDFDDTLLASPHPPAPRADDDLTWWCSPHSLNGIGLPGYDARWNLDLVGKLRQLSEDDQCLIMILTGRTGTPGMYRRIHQLLGTLTARIDQLQLKPLTFPGSTSQYKATVLDFALSSAKSNPITHVSIWDDLVDNHKAMVKVLKKHGMSHELHLV